MPERSPEPHAQEETRYRVLAHLANHPDATQREIAVALGVSVGKINYCIRALVRKGLVRMQNFRNSRKKSAYLYLLTPIGIEEKVAVTTNFLRRRIAEYEALRHEIEQLKNEVEQSEARDVENRRESSKRGDRR